MTFAIMTNMVSPGNDMFYDPKFRHMVENHINILRATGIPSWVPAETVYKFEGNFNGFLMDRNIQPWKHWIYMRVNRMENPMQFGDWLRDPYNRRTHWQFIEPNEGKLNEIQQYYISLKNK